MNIEEKNYVQWSFPTESVVQQVESTDIDKLKFPPGVLYFKFFKMLTVKTIFNGQEVVLSSNPIENDKKSYIYGGEEFTLEQIEKDLGDARFARKLAKLGHTRAARTRYGSVIPIDNDTVVLAVRKDQEYSKEDFDKIIAEKSAEQDSESAQKQDTTQNTNQAQSASG